jgi:hypothetical protein
MFLRKKLLVFLFGHLEQIFDRHIFLLYWVENPVIQENVRRNHRQVVNVAKQLRGLVHLLPDHNLHLMDCLLVVMFEID